MHLSSNTNPEPRIISRLGVVSIELSPITEVMLTETKSIGFTANPLGYNLGYSNQMIAALPSTCKVVFWVTDIKQLEKIKDLFENIEGICPLINKTGEKE